MLLTAIVLAGGQSSRMGRDKALITIEGAPLLQKICHLALQCTSEVYVVTPWPERYQNLLPNACRLIQEVSLPGNERPQGPLVGFAQGLAQVKTDWVMLLACDLPRLRIKVLQSWIGELTKVVESAMAVNAAARVNSPNSYPRDIHQLEPIAFLPRQAKGWEPLCGFYRRSCLPALTDFIDQGGRSFQQWLNQNVVQELPLDNPQVLFNCNTPDDLALLESN